MIFFSQKIKFKKESQSLGLNLKDKHIKKHKLQLHQLNKQHSQIDQNLKLYKTQFDQQKNKLINQHQMLLQQDKTRKQKILKLSIRKDQLLSKENPSITLQKAQTLKKYLQSIIYTKGDRYEIIRYLGNPTVYEFIKTKVLNLQHRIFLKAKMKEVVFMKKIMFEDQLLMLVIKEKQSPEILKSPKQTQLYSQKSKTIKSIMNPSKFNPSTQTVLNNKKSYQVKIYALTGKSFEYTKVYTEQQFKYFIDRLMNKKKPAHRSNRFSQITQQDNRKPRLSLQFNPVFRKSLEGFFFKRTSLTASQIQNKLVNVDQWLKQSKNSQKSGKDSERSMTEHLETSQQKNELNQTIMSKSSHAQSQNLSSRQTNTKNQSMKTESYLQNDKDSIQKTNQQLKCQSSIKQTQKQSDFNQENLLTQNSPTKEQHEISYASGFVRSFMEDQQVLFPDSNPLLNIVILKSKNTFQFLTQYLDKKQKIDLITFCVKKYQLKIKLQKQVRKSLLYKIIRIQNFFQSENKEIQPFSLNVLFSVKYAKNDVYIPKTSDFKEHLKLGKGYQIHQKLKGKPKNGFEGLSKDFKTFNGEDIVVTCQNIKCESEQKTFLINHLLKEEVVNDLNNKFFNMMNNVSTVNTRTKGRGHQQLQLKRNQRQSRTKDDKQKQDKRKIRKKKTTKEKVYNNQILKQDQERKDLYFREEIQNMFDSFLQQNILSIKQYRFLRKIDYQSHLNKIIIIQKNLKSFYYKKLYKKQKRFPLVFKFEPNTKILISAILDPDCHQVKIFTECLVLRLNNKYKSYPLIFSDRYWATIGTALNNLTKVSNSIVEVKDDLQKYLQRKITIYEQQQAKLEALKPQLYLNRLRRFFINIMLRVKVKKNIMFLKKINSNSETYVLIIRRSSFLNSVCQANLYHLQEFYERQQNKSNNQESLDEEKQVLFPQQQTGKTINIHQGNKKLKYQTINLLVDYFSNIPKQKIPDQFYFDQQRFLLKPPLNPSVYYIERLIMVDINSQEIAKQVAMIQWQDPSKKKKNLEHGSFLNLEEISESKVLQSFNSKSQMINSKLGLKNQDNKLKLQRKNASIMVENEMEKKLMLPGDKIIKERSSFRISERNKCVILRQEHQSKQGSRESKQLAVKKDHSLIKQESKSMLSSNNKLSRSSLYDIFNNSNKKTQYEIKGNGHGKFIYYSLAKVEEIFFQLRIYIIKRTFLVINTNNPIPYRNTQEQKNLHLNNKKLQNRLVLGQKIAYNCRQQTEVEEQHQFFRKNAFSDELLLVHKENINKKQLIQANWTFFYNRIAHWIKKNQHLLLLVDETNSKI